MLVRKPREWTARGIRTVSCGSEILSCFRQRLFVPVPAGSARGKMEDIFTSPRILGKMRNSYAAEGAQKMREFRIWISRLSGRADKIPHLSEDGGHWTAAAPPDAHLRGRACHPTSCIPPDSMPCNAYLPSALPRCGHHELSTLPSPSIITAIISQWWWIIRRF
jgi:hypothetical protein